LFDKYYCFSINSSETVIYANIEEFDRTFDWRYFFKSFEDVASTEKAILEIKDYSEKYYDEVNQSRVGQSENRNLNSCKCDKRGEGWLKD